MRSYFGNCLSGTNYPKRGTNPFPQLFTFRTVYLGCERLFYFLANGLSTDWAVMNRYLQVYFLVLVLDCLRYYFRLWMPVDKLLILFGYVGRIGLLISDLA